MDTQRRLGSSAKNEAGPSSDVYVVILGGGEGKRLWPASRSDHPKQFLAVGGTKSLMQQTVERALLWVDAKQILVATNERFKALIRRQLKGYGIPAANFLWEPAPRNTAPAIAWAAWRLRRHHPEAVMAVWPSDHHIGRRDAFLSVCRRAVKAAEAGYLVTMGIRPTAPATGYGYIRLGPPLPVGGVHRVHRFVEKPSQTAAGRYVQSGRYLWNGGVFFWRVDAIVGEIRAHAPEIAACCDAILDDSRDLKQAFDRMPSISIDYAVMEHTRKAAVVRAGGIGWSDVGGWEAAAAWLPALDGRKQGLSLDGTVKIFRRTQGRERYYAVAGLSDVIIVETDDCVLILKEGCGQALRQVTARLAKMRPDLL